MPRTSKPAPWLSALLACALWAPGAAGARSERAAPQQQAPQADLCAGGGKDAQRMAEEGLRQYKEAAQLGEQGARAKAFERSLRCFQAAIGASQTSAAKLYHPLGLVYEKLERYVEAVESFKRFLAEVPEGRRNVGVTKQITDKLKALRHQVAELAIDTVPGLEVRVDERVVGRAPLPGLVVVTPGPHVVTVGSPDVGTQGAELNVAAGQVHRVDLTAWRPREQIAGADKLPQKEKQEPERRLAGLQLTSNRRGASVQIDGAPVGALPLGELPLVPGYHTVRARDGSQVVQRDLTLGDKEHRALDLRFPVKPWVWGVVGVAAAVVVGTAVGLGVYYGTGVNRPDGVVSMWQ